MSTQDTKPKRKISPFIFGAVLLGGSIFGYQKISYMLHNEETENSQLEANFIPISAKVGGYVTSVRIKDNQVVKAGDTIATIDDRELKIKVLQAEVALKNAEANLGLASASAGTANFNINSSDANVQAVNASVSSSESAILTAKDNAEAQKIRVDRATADYNRYKKLLDEKSITQQQFENAKAEKETAEALLRVAESQIATAGRSTDVVRKQLNAGTAQKNAVQSQLITAQRQTNVAKTLVEQRKAELDLAKLNLSYCAVIAPESGEVSKKSVLVGQLVNPGQPLMTLVDNSSVWVIANFKETQIGKMKIGNKVHLKVDAYKGKDFEGTIESFAGATGGKFSLLPPDNSTGNFVKVVQRVPTKIIIDNNNDAATPLRLGMSVNVVVPVK